MRKKLIKNHNLNIFYLANEICKGRVAEQEPTPGGDSVGFVLELSRLHFIEIFEAVNKTKHIEMRLT